MAKLTRILVWDDTTGELAYAVEVSHGTSKSATKRLISSEKAKAESFASAKSNRRVQVQEF